MVLYSIHLLPQSKAKIMARKRSGAVGARVCEGLEGVVVEVGFGTALNAPYYPPAVKKVVAIEPSRVCMRIAEPRIAKATVPVEYGGLTREAHAPPTAKVAAGPSPRTPCARP